MRRAGRAGAWRERDGQATVLRAEGRDDIHSHWAASGVWPAALPGVLEIVPLGGGERILAGPEPWELWPDGSASKGPGPSVHSASAVPVDEGWLVKESGLRTVLLEDGGGWRGLLGDRGLGGLLGRPDGSVLATGRRAAGRPGAAGGAADGGRPRGQGGGGAGDRVAEGRGRWAPGRDGVGRPSCPWTR